MQQTYTAAASPMPAERTDGHPLVWLFLTTLLLYVLTAGSNFTSGDAYAELRVTQSLVEHRWFDEAPSPKCRPGSGYGEPGRDGRCYATHGIGYSLLLLPGYLAARLTIAGLGVPYCTAWTYCVPIHLVSWTTCLIGALTVLLLCRLCIDLGYGLHRSVFVGLTYGFASLAWPYARYGFDVAPTALFLLAAVREAILAGTPAPTADRPDRWLRAGCWSALAVCIRLPTLAAVTPLLMLALVSPAQASWQSRLSSTIRFLVPVGIALLFNGWYNLVRFGGVLDDGHAHNAADNLSRTPWLGLLGMLISPGKGLIWYCPVVLLACIAMPAFVRRHGRAAILAAGVALCSVLPYALVNDWYGGDAWGPRFMVPVLPLILLPLAELPDLCRGSFLRTALAGVIIGAGGLLALAGQLVSYSERLRQVAREGIGDRLFWDPRWSPILDHLRTLVGYFAHPGDALRTTGEGAQSFDIWWLNLWRNDQVPPLPTLLAGAVLAALAGVAAIRLVAALRCATSRSAGASPTGASLPG